MWLNLGAQTHELRRWDEQESESALKIKFSKVNPLPYHDYKSAEECDGSGLYSKTDLSADLEHQPEKPF